MITIFTFGMRCPRRILPKAATTVVTTMVVATTAAMTVETLAMTMTAEPKDFREASDVLCGLPSLHLEALRNGRRMFPGHRGDDAAYGGFGERGRRRLQVPKP
jgi:hypothetical protein